MIWSVVVRWPEGGEEGKEELWSRVNDRPVMLPLSSDQARCTVALSGSWSALLGW